MATVSNTVVHILGGWSYQRWCPVCLTTTEWVMLFMRLGNDGTCYRHCSHCGHERMREP